MSKKKEEREILRLDKFLSSQLGISRKDAHKLIYKGLVTVDGECERRIDRKLEPVSAAVSVEGREIAYRKHRYIMMNKPAGVISSTDNSREETVLDLVPEELYRKGLFPAGRLDKDSVGFVLLTDDGAFAHRMLSPKHHVSKTYEVLLDKPLSPESIRRIEEGIVLGDGTRCKPARIDILQEIGAGMLVQVVLTEGKYHQIKRMMAASGSEVLRLKRTKIGGLELDNRLREGECREIMYKELKKIL